MTSAVTSMPRRLGPPDDLDRAGRRDVAHVQPGPDVPGEQHVAGDDRLLGDGRPAAQPENRGDRALVHLGVLGQPRLLGVLGDDSVERLDVLQGPTHEDCVADAPAVVGEDPDTGRRVGHRAELGEPLPREAHRHRTDRPDVDPAGAPAEPPHLLDDPGGVGDGRGVRHRVDGGEPAEGGRLRAGLDGLGVLPAGLAQVGVQVDEARAGATSPSASTTRVAGVRQAPAYLGDDPVPDEDVGGLPAEDPGTADEPGLRGVRAHARTPSVRTTSAGASSRAPARSR